MKSKHPQRTFIAVATAVHRARTAQLLFAVAAVAAVAACSLAIDADAKQCEATKDCLGHGLSSAAVCVERICLEPVTSATDGGVEDAQPVDPIWGCLGSLSEPPVAEPNEPVRLRTAFYSIISSAPLAGVPMRACEVADAACASPLPGSSVQTDERGAVDVPLYSGFRGYLEISPPADDPDLVPSILTVFPVPDKRNPEGATGVSWGLLTKAEMTFAAASAGKPIYDRYGHVFFFVTDCRGAGAGGAVARVDKLTADTFTWYTDALGTPGLTQGKTTNSGNGAFMNLSPGTVTVTLALEDGRHIGTQNLVVREGSITYVNFRPSR